MTVDKSTLGERLTLVRTRRQWSIATVAAGAGISEARLYHIERGDVWPDLPVLVKLCRTLGVDETPMLEEGDEWYARLKSVGAISGPHVFDLPTQFDPALQIEGWVPPDPGVRDAHRPFQNPLPPKPETAKPQPVEKGPRAPKWPVCADCGRRRALFGFGYCWGCLR